MRVNLLPMQRSHRVDQFSANPFDPWRKPAPPGSGVIARALAAPTLGDLFRYSVIQHADRLALWTEAGTLTYAELLERAEHIAGPLLQAGLADDSQRCGILGDRSTVDFIGILGALLARNTYVPMNLRHPVQRLARILAEADLASLVVGRAGLQSARTLLETAPHPLLVLLPECEAVPDFLQHLPQHSYVCRNDLFRPDRLPQGAPDDGAYLLFTSGSTGEPKGVLVRHRNALPYLRQAAERYHVGPDDRCTQLFDLTFDLSVHDMFLTWGAGASLFRVPDKARFAPRSFVQRHTLTTWFSVPSTAATMLGLRALRPGDFPSLRLSLFCGEALPQRVALAWAEAAPNARIENIYGPTEATIAITGFALPGDRVALRDLPEVLPVGTAFPGQYAVVVDAQGQPAQEGELCLAGSQVTDGYWRRPDLTSQRFVRFSWDNEQRVWYRTGDRARTDTEFGLRFLGRLDRQAKIAGHRIEFQEVEAALHRAANANAAAIAWPLGPDGLARGIVGFVGQTEHSVEAILAACRATLPPYAVPSAIYRVEDWPLNSSGKTDHRRLQQIVERIACQTTTL